MPTDPCVETCTQCKAMENVHADSGEVLSHGAEKDHEVCSPTAISACHVAIANSQQAMTQSFAKFSLEKSSQILH